MIYTCKNCGMISTTRQSVCPSCGKPMDAGLPQGGYVPPAAVQQKTEGSADPSENTTEVIPVQSQMDSSPISFTPKDPATAFPNDGQAVSVNCVWCGQKMGVGSGVSEFGVLLCSQRCRKDYREQLQTEGKLQKCSVCGSEMVDIQTVKDYDDVVVGTLEGDDGKTNPLTLKELKEYDRENIVQQITACLNTQRMCKTSCCEAYLKEHFEHKKEQTAAIEYVALCHVKNETYSRAKSMQKNADFEKAATLFESLRDFKDAAQCASLCREAARRKHEEEEYGKAVKLVHQCEFEKAAALFESIRDVKDSAVQAKQCLAYIAKFDELIDQAEKITKNSIPLAMKPCGNINRKNYKQVKTDQKHLAESLKEAKSILMKIPAAHRSYKNVNKLINQVEAALKCVEHNLLGVSFYKITRALTQLFLFLIAAAAVFFAVKFIMKQIEIRDLTKLSEKMIAQYSWNETASIIMELGKLDKDAAEAVQVKYLAAKVKWLETMIDTFIAEGKQDDANNQIKDLKVLNSNSAKIKHKQYIAAKIIQTKSRAENAIEKKDWATTKSLIVQLKKLSPDDAAVVWKKYVNAICKQYKEQADSAIAAEKWEEAEIWINKLNKQESLTIDSLP